MYPESSLPCSQDSTTGPCSELVGSFFLKTLVIIKVLIKKAAVVLVCS